MKQYDLTSGSITKRLLLFALPMMIGNLLQQCYNIADTLIVGRYLGGTGTGCGRFRLYINDISYLHPDRDVYGKRGGIFYPFRGKRQPQAEGRDPSFFWTDRSYDFGYQSWGISWPGLDP